MLDENLPSRLGFALPLPVTHSTDLGSRLSDTEIWDYAMAHDLVIISKDADFSDRIALREPPPWVIHLRIGNLRKGGFHAFLERHWATIFGFLPTHKLVNVYSDRVEGIA